MLISTCSENQPLFYSVYIYFMFHTNVWLTCVYEHETLCTAANIPMHTYIWMSCSCMPVCTESSQPASRASCLVAIWESPPNLRHMCLHLSSRHVSADAADSLSSQRTQTKSLRLTAGSHQMCITNTWIQAAGSLESSYFTHIHLYKIIPLSNVLNAGLLIVVEYFESELLLLSL